MPVTGDDDEEPPFRPLTPEQQKAMDARVAKQDGILGDGELKAGKYNMRLVNRAIRNGWNVPQEVKARVVKQMSKIVSQSEEERNKIAAAKVLVSADSVDVAREKMEQPQAGTTVNVAVGVSVSGVRQQLLNDPEYLDYLRSRPVACDSDAGAIREGGEQPSLETGEPSNGVGPGHNGHANGNGRH